jgi:hypothetical protein
MMEGIKFIILGILAISTPTLAILFLCGVFKVGELFCEWLNLKKVELENKRKIEER